MPLGTEMEAYADAEYESGVYKSYFAARRLKIATAERRLADIERLTPYKRLLDIGCSIGFFMETAQQRGFDVTGIEFSQVAISMAVPVVKDRILRGDVNQLLTQAETRYDVVTAFDIIEHTHDPIAFVRDIHRCLAPGGLLVLSTPDTGHFLRRAMGRAWPMLQPMQHTVLFSRGAMVEMLIAAGFAEVQSCTAAKILTIDYLGEQLEELNPLLVRVYKGMSWILPAQLRTRPLSVNIGEFVVFARKPK
jgi:SAM-dependent methyltransferase